MSINLKHSSSSNIRISIASGQPIEAITFIYHAEGSEIISSESSSEVIIDDVVYDRALNTVYWDNGDVVSVGFNVETFSSDTPSVATIDNEGVVSRISEGSCVITAVGGSITRYVTLDLNNKGGAEKDTFNRMVVGSLAEHIWDEFDSRATEVLNVGDNFQVYSTQDHVTPNYVRHVNHWAWNGASAVDITCVSPWNDAYNSRNNLTTNVKAGTLITPRHMINAAHYPLSVGDKVRFIDNDDNVVVATIAGAVTHPDYTGSSSNYAHDFRVYTFTEDVPSAIKPCLCMPSDWVGYLPTLPKTQTPVFLTDQNERTVIHQMWFNSKSSSFGYANQLSPWGDFSKSFIAGDSGSPAFTIVNGECVLLTVLTFGFGGGGSAVADHIDDINTMITTADTQAGVSTDYTVIEADFSAFPTY